MERLMIKGDSVSRRKRKTSTSTRAKKKKKPIHLLSLPYDLLVMIVARVPILYYRKLSLVSKSFRSLVASPELYKVRSLLGLTESCIYVCLRFGSGSKWYTLSSKSKSSGGYVLDRVLPVPPDDDDHSPCHVGLGYSDLVAVGSDIYNIGVADKTGLPARRSSRVSILDCKTHTWRKAPSMPVEVEALSARVLDRKIYVLGRRQRYEPDGSWKSWLHVFNTDTQTWDIPWCVLDRASHTFNIDGNLHAVNIYGGVFTFNSKQGNWDLLEQYPGVSAITYSKSYCEIDNVLYSVSKDGDLRWYDTDKTRWRDLKGLVGLPKFLGYDSYVKLTGYGGGAKMVVFWISSNFNTLLSTIYCAEIALERRDGDCWGKLEWYGSVHSVLLGTELVKVLSVML